MFFATKLSLEQIKLRLHMNTMPFNSLNNLTENQFLSKWIEDNEFYLWKTGVGMLSVRPVLPFIGKVVTKDGDTVIVGDFSLMKSLKIFLSIVIGLAWILAFSLCFMNSSIDLYGKVPVFLIVSIWSVGVYAFVRYIPGVFQENQRRLVLEFIENHLLR